MWTEVIDAVEEGEDCTSLAGETSITAAAGFAAEALVSSDLKFDGLCDYLDGVSNADPTLAHIQQCGSLRPQHETPRRY